MRKLLIFTLLLLSIYSCTPASYGSLHQDEKGCTVLTNTSSTDKITFVMKYDTIDYKWEETVGPQEDKIMDCEGHGDQLRIVSAYVKN